MVRGMFLHVLDPRHLIEESLVFVRTKNMDEIKVSRWVEMDAKVKLKISLVHYRGRISWVY